MYIYRNEGSNLKGQQEAVVIVW